MPLLLCECRALFRNPELCKFVEEGYRESFKATHTDLKNRTEHAVVKQTIDELFSMVVLEDKK